MKKTFIIVLLVALFSSSLFSQERTTMDILTSYKWVISSEILESYKDPDDPDDSYPIEAYMLFTETTCSTCERWSDNSDVIEESICRYYLVNEINIQNTTFNESNVGKTKNGNYIIEERVSVQSPGIFQIRELTETKLVIFSIGTIGGGESTWEARPKD